MSITCFVLSVAISFAVFVFSPKPFDTSDRCATSDQFSTMSTEHGSAVEQLSPRRKHVSVQPSKRRGGNRAASPAPELKQNLGADAACLLPGGTFEARSQVQVTFPLFSSKIFCDRVICGAAFLLRLHRVQSQIFHFFLAPRDLRRALRGRLRGCRCEDAPVSHVLLRSC
jgi:hypothetical protein